jgi:hypothetical protein
MKTTNHITTMKKRLGDQNPWLSLLQWLRLLVLSLTRIKVLFAGVFFY